MSTKSLWPRFNEFFLRYPDLSFSIDISRMSFPDDFFMKLQPAMDKAFKAMDAVEAGEIANPDEGRMVGHYWLRAPELAPTEALRTEINEIRESIAAFCAKIHSGEMLAPNGGKFTDVLLVGIGGSALGPQLAADALGGTGDAMKIHFLDNTDPDGIDRVTASLGAKLANTLTVVISKSGGTKETRNGMLEAEAAYKAQGLDFPPHAVAVTGIDSLLDKVATEAGWLARFPMSDWVGGRTSIMSAVGLMPMGLQGLDVTSFLAGAAAMDKETRVKDYKKNAAMLLAAMWYYAGDGRGKKDMVILPYKDRFVLFSKYLQQLVMESLGKENDLDGKLVNQGIAVYGNKGSTDQHAYVQQLRDGVPNFFATFVEVRKDRAGARFEVEDGVTSGDYLQGFLRGTRSALFGNGRESITLSVWEAGAFELGALIGLFERAVGFYAILVNINAYHQPGVEAGKKAATRLLELQAKVRATLPGFKNGATAEAVATQIGTGTDAEDVYHVLTHLAANSPHVTLEMGNGPATDLFKPVA